MGLFSHHLPNVRTGAYTVLYCKFMQPPKICTHFHLPSPSPRRGHNEWWPLWDTGNRLPVIRLSFFIQWHARMIWENERINWVIAILSISKGHFRTYQKSQNLYRRPRLEWHPTYSDTLGRSQIIYLWKICLQRQIYLLTVTNSAPILIEKWSICPHFETFGWDFTESHLNCVTLELNWAFSHVFIH